MIKINNKVYGEKNHPNTVIADKKLTPGKFVYREAKLIKSLDTTGQGILIIDSNGKPTTYPITEPNVLIGTDSTGKLTHFKLDRLPDEVPPNRHKISEISGNIISGINHRTIILEGPAYYEVEVFGAGGGGGGSGIIRMDQGAQINASSPGSKGGAGGYYKKLFSVLQDTVAVLLPGNSGGGGMGHVIDHRTSSVIVTRIGTGGTGGRNYESSIIDILYKGTDGTNIKTVRRLGGNTSDPTSTVGRGGHAGNGEEGFAFNSLMGAAGGGTSGNLGGAGGDAFITSSGWPTGTIDGYSYGAGGGAGGSGLGPSEDRVGAGGKFEHLDPSNNVLFTIEGGLGYGGGGGGAGSTRVYPDGNEGYIEADWHSAGGGGGGGASRFTTGDIDIICGGGGGGAGTNEFYALLGIGKPGTNNQPDAVPGGGSQGGLGGQPINYFNPVNDIVNSHGQAGKPGKIVVWKCVP